MSTHSGKKVKHFVYLSADEQLFIVTKDVAGFDEHQLVEIVFPTITTKYDGVQFDPGKTVSQRAVRWYDGGTLSCMTWGGEDDNGKYHEELQIIEAVAAEQTPKDEVAYVSVPLKHYLELVTDAIDRRSLTTLKAEPVND